MHRLIWFYPGLICHMAILYLKKKHRLIWFYPGLICHMATFYLKVMHRLIWFYPGPICHMAVFYLKADAQTYLVLPWSHMPYGRLLFKRRSADLSGFTLVPYDKLIWVYASPVCHKAVFYFEGDLHAGLILRKYHMTKGRFLFGRRCAG